jgi:endonuclease YncB( thermonuclease family)
MDLWKALGHETHSLLSLRVLLSFAVLGLGLLSETEADSATILEGTASVIDGDTIEIHGKRIRLDGFDTPERGAMCEKVNVYQKAALALSDFIGKRTVTCEIFGEDQYDRGIGRCQVGDESLAEFIVANGWGRDWPKHSKGEYADEEAAARSAGAGIWGLACPSDLWGDRNYD